MFYSEEFWSQHFELFLFNLVGVLLLILVPIGPDFIKKIFLLILKSPTLHYSEEKSIYQEKSLLE